MSFKGVREMSGVFQGVSKVFQVILGTHYRNVSGVSRGSRVFHKVS